MGRLGVIRIYLIVLPDAVPIPHGSTWFSDTGPDEPDLAGLDLAPVEGVAPKSSNGRNFVSLKFWQVPEEQGEIAREGTAIDSVIAAISGEAVSGRALDSPELEARRTVVEVATYVSRRRSRRRSQNLQPDPLTRCVDVLLDFHRAFRLSTESVCPKLTYERLPLMVLSLERKLTAPGKPPTVTGLTVLAHGNFPIHSDTEPEVSELGAHLARLRAADPFMLYKERRLDARSECVLNGRFGESVVHSAIAAEVLFDAVLGLALWEEYLAGTLTEDEVAEVFARDLTPRLKSEYHPRFGGNWSLTGPNLRLWHKQIAGVRNRVVHSGFTPERPVAEDAQAVLIDLERFVGDRLACKVSTYPRTAWIYLGHSGLDRRGLLKGALELEVVKEKSVADSVLTWIEAYQVWREAVNELVTRRRQERPTS